MSDMQHSPQYLSDNAAKNQLSVARMSAPNALQPTIQNIGDRSSQNSDLDEDHEFFLDAFNEIPKPQISGIIQQVDDDEETNFQTFPRCFETDQTGTDLWVSSYSDWEEEMLPTEVEEDEVPQRWDLSEFMKGSRSASQQGSIEFGVQMSWGMKFAAGRVHSMIRCSEQEPEQPEPIRVDYADNFMVSATDEDNGMESTYVELANRFLAFNESNPAVRPFAMVDQLASANVDVDRVIVAAGDEDNNMEPTYADLANRFVASMDNRGNLDSVVAAVNLTSTGRPCCSHPGCIKQAQAKGLCIAHGGIRQCTYPDCKAISRWRGLCGAHSGKHTCSEEGCKNRVKSRGKCEKHGGGTGSKCSFPGCTTRAIRKDLCAAHGGSLVCKIEGCEKKALTKGLCGGHGGGTRCKVEGCGKTTSARGFCHHHAVDNGVTFKPRGKCIVEGCLKIKLNGSYCTKHAKERGMDVVRKCRMVGCGKSAQKGGLCISHGGGSRCTHPECSKQAYSKGLCGAHGGRITCKVKGCPKWGLSKGDIKGYCVKHGGGKRCKHPGCNKSVQYNDLCCTHGGWCACEAEGCNKRVKWKGFCPLHKTTEEKEA